ncbi:helix-turn-helix domain-containing protein [Posidoniimonas polymericola]|uniref:helix-turn-helix domain-containing protein n=1 Tax=Posidoniimonas polymericola TaxID=2528002 RepID=UPI0018D4B420|nr:DnaA/Hda family protein [Posidoniimonas polymericola]
MSATSRAAQGAAGGVVKLPLSGRRMHATSDDPSTAAACTLPSFVAGPENRLVAAVFERLLDDKTTGQTPSESAPSGSAPAGGLGVGSLLLLGPSGSGKTHLARGLGEAWNARLGHTKNGDSQVAYLTASDFRRQVASAVSDRSIDALRRQLRRCRLLVLDDLPRLAGEAYVLEELVHTLDALSQSGALFVAASQKPPAELPGLSRALIGRLLSGLTLEIAPPRLAAQQELLLQALTAMGCSATAGALRALAEQAPADPRQLLGVAMRIRRRLRAGTVLDEQTALGLIKLDLQRPTPPASDILTVVARYYGLPKTKLTSSSRQKSIVLARAVAIFLIRELTPLSYDQIGKMLGGRDHSTVLHNYRRIERAQASDRVLGHALGELRRSITVGAAA